MWALLTQGEGQSSQAKVFRDTLEGQVVKPVGKTPEVDGSFRPSGEYQEGKESRIGSQELRKAAAEDQKSLG